jgi:hypothetical protein
VPQTICLSAGQLLIRILINLCWPVSSPPSPLSPPLPGQTPTTTLGFNTYWGWVGPGPVVVTDQPYTFRLLCRRHRFGQIPHVRDCEWGRCQVLGQQRLRPARHWKHEHTIQPSERRLWRHVNVNTLGIHSASKRA